MFVDYHRFTGPNVYRMLTRLATPSFEIKALALLLMMMMNDEFLVVEGGSTL